MAAPLDASRKQRAVIEFLYYERENTANIHRKLLNVYGKATHDISTVRKWVGTVNSNLKENGKIDYRDTSHNSSPADVINADKAKQNHC